MIPEINLSALKDPGRRAWRDLAEEMAQVYSDVGFAYVTGHGIAPAHLISVFQMSRNFHALPEETKQALALNENHRGYIPMAASTDRTSALGAAKHPNLSDSFMMMGNDPTAGDELYLNGSNQWPDLLGFRRVMLGYMKAMTELGAAVTGLFEASLGADAGALTRSFDPATTWLRLLRYPVQEDAPEAAFGSAPHTDFGFLTFLATDGSAGLQVQASDGDWLDVPFKPGAFVLNTGEMARRCSNGQLLATPHRVITPTARTRFSVPFFYDPHMTANVAPLPSCGEPKIEPIVFGDYVRAQLEGSYDAHAKEN